MPVWRYVLLMLVCVALMVALLLWLGVGDYMSAVRP
jgi:hypothetical protein